MPGPMPGVEAILQRFTPVPDGYLMAVRLAATVEVTGWYAEIVMPEDVQVQAGRQTTLERRPLSYKATPDDGHLRPPPSAVASGVVYIAVGADQRAPLRLRVRVDGVDTGGYATVTGVYVTGQRGRLVRSTEEWWPGSTTVNTSVEGWDHSGGGGFGGGGGGGGGGQAELIADIDETGKLRRLHHKTDGGGGGGAGGGGGWGADAHSWAESGQQAAGQQGDGGHGGGNPMTKLQTAVDDLAKRIEAIERRLR